MKATKKMLSLIGAAAMAGTASAVNVTIDKVQQRYPWNGLVDIDYQLDGGVSVDTKFQITVTANGTTYSATKFQQEFGRTKGTHRVTWDTAADNAKFFSKNATVKMSLVDTTGTYYIFDLVNGGDPVITNCTAEAFSDNVYKTDKLVMRKIDTTTYTYKNDTAAIRFNAGARTTGEVTVDAFLIGIYEVTSAQWAKFSSIPTSWTTTYQNNPYKDMIPISYISYNDIRGTKTNDEATTIDWPNTGDKVGADSYLGKLRAKINGDTTSGYLFDLQTDVQRQCAYRAGTTTAYYDGNNDMTGAAATKTLNTIAAWGGNYNAAGFNAIGMTGITSGMKIVGCYAANGFGLYDMAGNAFEWERDYVGAVGTTENLSVGSGRLMADSCWGGLAGAAYFSAGSRNGWSVLSGGAAATHDGVGLRLVSSIK